MSRHRQRVCLDSRENLDIFKKCVLTNLDASRQIAMRLDKSWQSQCISTISTKIMTWQSLNSKVSILKISTKKYKFLIATRWTICKVSKDGLDTKANLDFQSWLVLTVETPNLKKDTFSSFFLSDKKACQKSRYKTFHKMLMSLPSNCHSR